MTPRKLSARSVLDIATATGTTRARGAASAHPFGMVLTLPEPPSANRYWRIYRGRAVVSAEAKAYKATVHDEARRAGYRPFGPDVRVKVSLYWYRAKRMGDLDNRIKVTLDALRGVLYADDKQVVVIHAERIERPREGRLFVMVERVAP
jgi:crossover junction endodeoxyribonuclease RusA